MTVKKVTISTNKKTGRENVRWLADVGSDAKHTRERRKFRFEWQAIEFENQAKANLVTTGLHIPRSQSLPLWRAFQLWLEARKTRKLSTYRGYLYLGNRFICCWAADQKEILDDRYGFARRRLSEIPPADIRLWVEGLLNEKTKRQRSVSAETIASALTILHGIYDYMLITGRHRGANPTDPVMGWLSTERRHGSMRKAPLRVGVDIPTDAEANAYLRAAAEHGLRYAAITKLQVYCGLRIGEILGLLWSDFEFEHYATDKETGERFRLPLLHLNRGLDVETGEIQTLKTPASYRTVPLIDEVADTLTRWRIACPRTRQRVLSTAKATSEEIAAWLHVNPTASDFQIAKRLGINCFTVTRLRRGIGLPDREHPKGRKLSVVIAPPDDSDCPAVKGIPWVISDERAQLLARFIWHNPKIPNRQVARLVKVNENAPRHIRAQLGIPPLPKGRVAVIEASQLVEPTLDTPRLMPNEAVEYHVFPTRSGKPMKYAHVAELAQRFQVAANLKGPDSTRAIPNMYKRANHVWRHYFATLLLSERTYWQDVAYLLGHASAKSTMDTYGHLVRDVAAQHSQIRAAVKRATGRSQLQVVGTNYSKSGTIL